jgi:phosphatidylglycerophosphate synthase
VARYTTSDVWASYSAAKRWSELRGDLPSYFIYRPLSVYLTPVLVRMKIGPMPVTLSAMAIALALPAVAYWAGPQGYALVAVMALAHHVLDCVDGNIARLTDRTSVLGRLLDAWGDVLFWTTFSCSLGLLVQGAGGGLFGGYAVPVGLVVAVIFLLQTQVRDTYALQTGSRAEFSSVPPATLSVAAKARIAVIGLERVYALGLLIAGLINSLDIFLLAVFVYTALIAAGALAVTLRAAAR